MSVQIYETYQGMVTHPLLWIFLGLTAVFYLVQGLVTRKPRERAFDTLGWVRRHYVAIVFVLGGAAIVAAVTFYLADVGISISYLVDRLRLESPAPEMPATDVRDLGQGIALLLGAVVAAATIPFTLLRTWINERTATATEQGLITDRINTAVEGLGAEKEVNRIGRAVTVIEFDYVEFVPSNEEEARLAKNPPKRTEIQWRGEPTPVKAGETEGDVGQWQVFTETAPNLEVRIGAIYALERLSQDSERDHIQIMEILCAYIRQNAQAQDVALPEGKPTPVDWVKWASEGQEHPRLDVDVALKVIERRDAKRKQHETDNDYRLGFERAPLRKIILTGRDLNGANLRDAQLQGADLRDAQLQGANLGFAQLQGTNLWDAQLQGANLGGAQLQGAKLGGAKLQGAKFDGDISLTAATLRGAAVRDVNFTEIAQIRPHLEGMFGDGSVTLPGGHGPELESWPKHWPRFALDDEQFDEEWRKWLDDPEGYVPPEPPEEDAQG